MRYPASEKLEIIRLVERSHRPAKQTLDLLGVPRTTFYRWYAHYCLAGEAALQDQAPLPVRVWNRIPDTIREQVISLALDCPELSPRELAVTFTDTEGYFVSESSVYRLLKAHDLITSPAFIVITAASEFKDKTTAINQQWQTDFTYLKIIGWGWMYLSTILDDFSRVAGHDVVKKWLREKHFPYLRRTFRQGDLQELRDLLDRIAYQQRLILQLDEILEPLLSLDAVSEQSLGPPDPTE